MRFYMTPGSCSTGIHILLEECEVPFQVHIVNLLAGENLSPDFLAVNPRGSVPALALDDGRALTSFQSIALWLAAAHPERSLLPTDVRLKAHARDLMEYVVEVMHGEGFTRVFVPERYGASPAELAEVQAEGRRAVERGFRRVEALFLGAPYVLERFSIADAALFYAEFWADRVGIELPPRCQQHFEAMLGRASVRQVLSEEGYVSTLRKYAPSLQP